MTIDKNTLVRTIADVLYKKETITMEEKLARVGLSMEQVLDLSLIHISEPTRPY